ncbi:MAG TPA: hypothetical protein HPP83_03510 [Candidatus Hydrogenedentes bacterium]|nr:hypothetical protein [Candidatus Hydrogenedentota bacterium]
MTQAQRVLPVFSTILFLSFAATSGAAAQGAEDSFDFDTISGAADEAVVYFDGTFEYLLGNAKLELTYDDPSKPPILLRAHRFDFLYDTKGKQGLLEVVMSKRPEGDRGSAAGAPNDNQIRVEHPVAVVTADKATYNFAEGFILFEGNCLVDRSGMTATGNTVTMDLNTSRIVFQAFRVKDLRIEELRRPGEPPRVEDPSLLTVKDVFDWPALLRQVKAQAKADKPSPGKRVLELLDPDTRSRLLGLDPDAQLIDKDKTGIIKRINTVLAAPDLYTKAAWNGIDIGNEARDLIGLGTDKLEPEEVTRLNRLLIEAAYPKAIGRREPVSP